jgi:IrrE N-terminal-like domain
VNVPLWATELAAAFWAEVGEVEPFPRRLQRFILRTLDLSIVLLPRLRLFGVLEWLQRQGIEFPLIEADRPLRACLICCRGAGFVFLDGGDDDAEQRFSLAHELAHFLRHYWVPRRRASARLGNRILEVFDGERPAEAAERLDALLVGVPLGFYAHLMGRDVRANGAVAAAEAEADRLAYELLAPAEAVHARLHGGPANEVRGRAATVLRECFGLPAAQANDYAALLFPMDRPEPLLLHLGLKS